MPQLYIVEGLPCSGKSSTAQFIAGKLTANGQTVTCVDEGSGNHPADYEFHAYVSDSNLMLFTEQLQAQIRECSEHISGGYIVPLAHFEGDAFNSLLQYKIYDFLPWETEMPLMLDKWRSFVKNAEDNTVYIFNCVLLQNPMCETMMRFGFSEEQSFAYISEIAQIIKPLEPLVIYLSNNDTAKSVTETAKERDGWLEAVIDYHTNGEYGKSINAHGFDGYIACLEERQRRELSILGRLALKSVIIDNTDRDWNGTHRKVLDLIGL